MSVLHLPLQCDRKIFTRSCQADARNRGCRSGGNFFTDILGIGENSAGRVRVREALQTGADIIAVACPNCAKMLIDAVKIEELGGKLNVFGIAEIIERA